MITLVVLALGLVAAPEHAEHTAKKKPVGRHAAIAIPIDVGVGPVAMIANPPATNAQLVFSGLELSLAAVIDQQLIREHQAQIPAQYRRLARGIDEAEIRPWFLALVPSRLIISPLVTELGGGTIYGEGAGMYGAVWRPFGAGFTLLDKPVRVGVNGAVDVAYIFIHSPVLGGGTTATNSITHFLRPGVNLNLTATLPITKTLLISAGWSSDLFVPQPFGRPPWEIFPVEDSLWHLGGPFVAVHVRIPYEVNL